MTKLVYLMDTREPLQMKQEHCLSLLQKRQKEMRGKCLCEQYV